MYKIMDGNEACSHVSYNFTEVAGIYPITPSSYMAELLDKWSKEGKENYFKVPSKVVEMQSEAGAAGMIHGSLQAGCLTTTYTASQGLLLMIPSMYKIAGEMLPGVIHVAARSLATHALSILGDHQDVYATRMTGFAILASSSVQQVMDLTSIAHLSTIKGSIPFLHFFDGFRTSHELQKIDVINFSKLKELIDEKALKEFRDKANITGKAITRGTAQNDDIYFQNSEARNKYYNELPDIVNNYMLEINSITGRSYKPFNYYGANDATKVIIAMGSVCETIKETIEYLNKKGEKLGLIEVHLYRPFSSKYLLNVLPKTTKKIAVLDRTKEPGSSGEPLYLDVVDVINKYDNNIKVIGGRYGLSSKNTNPACIKAVYDFLNDENNFNGFTVGIEDDVTNLSIAIKPFTLPTKNIEFCIYGYGSDGMVSACKDIMKITGEHSNAFVQGYFEYDSKKSGGVTKSHLRFGKDEIKSTYYVENPSLVVCTKENYLYKFDILEGIKEKGTFILNTNKKEEEIKNVLPNKIKKIIKEKKLNFYIADCLSLSKEVGLDHKISSIMEAIIFKVTHLIDTDYALSKMKEAISNKFSSSANNIVDKNIEAIDKALDLIEKIDFNNLDYEDDKGYENKSIFEVIDNREGNSLPVSSFLKNLDGAFEGGLSKLEKRASSDIAPCYIKENCIMCNQCSLVCPHAVIRPYLLDEEETENAPLVVKEDLLDSNIKGENLNYTIGVSVLDCTGCKLCVNVCPGKNGKKALTMENTDNLIEDKMILKHDYLSKEVTTKEVMNKKTIKGSQFRKPLFEFPGACAGCGEPAYLKLLTQLFKDNLVIANATGCSSIYSASMPSTAYSVPWSNSLFENNAEFGYGMKIADDMQKDKIKKIISDNLEKVVENKEVYEQYLESNDYETSEELYNLIDTSEIVELKQYKEFIKKKTFFIIGGDGWAYDIGFSGIDHVLANHDNINILVLDTEVYSNTGGQSSKASQIGSIAKFTNKGKEIAKKDLAKIALTYPHVYVGTIALGANPMHTIKVLTEAENYDGPSIIIAYAPCIAHGILKGMENTIAEQKLAVESGYFPLFHYNPIEEEFKLDSKADFSKYYEFISGEERYRKLKKINKDKYRELLEKNKEEAIKRYDYYQQLSEK